VAFALQVDARIALAERGTGALRGIYQEEAAAVLEMQDEVNVAQSTLQKVANDLAAQHATNIGLRAVRAHPPYHRRESTSAGGSTQLRRV